ncbi:MAG: WYL domain-containing transcriptional regulator [Lachnospiraceae bacterium]|nr:WYL domain-containing transcriptional regulator [Lachnospiraceae bacterium]
MAKGAGQKLKLLYIIKILSEQTDEFHPITTKDLIVKLEEYGVSAERKSIYNDISQLTDFGYDIIQIDNRSGGGYYLGARDFELAELKLLVDAVQSSRFITQKKSRELISKLEKLTSRHDGIVLQRQVFVAGRIKTENESIFYHVDTIHKAIFENRKIGFVYLDYDVSKKLVPRKGGQKYIISPWALIWKEENYYLLGYDNKDEMVKHYRVDKMDAVEMTGENRDGGDAFENIDLAQYTNKAFGMYSGEEETVTLSFQKSLLGVVIDRFGTDISIREDGEKLRARVKVLVSGQFFGWLCGIGSGITIAGPDKVREEYKKRLLDLAMDYREKADEE